MPENSDKRHAPEVSAEEARQGWIVLDTPQKRWSFVAGIVALVLLGIYVAYALAF